MNIRAFLPCVAAVMLWASAGAAWAQHRGHTGAQHSAPAPAPASCTPEHARMGHCTMPSVQAPTACTPAHAAMGHCAMPAAADAACTPQHRAMGHCTSSAVKESETCTAEHAAMGHCTLPPSATDAAADCPPEHAAMGHCAPSEATDPACPPEHAAMGHCTPRKPAPIQPLEPIPAVTESDRAAAFPPIDPHSAHESHPSGFYTRTLFNRLEAWDASGSTSQAWEGSASFGGDIHRLWLRSEGERSGGTTESADLEVLYGRGISPWWDVVIGAKHDFKPGASQTWGAIGLQGLAPYFFEMSATAYVGDSGRISASFELEYDMLITNRLILQPLVELEFNSKSDPVRGSGSGLSKAEAGLRLRYELDRRFAPYVGIVHERSFGDTAEFHSAEGESTRDTRVVAGIRVWF